MFDLRAYRLGFAPTLAVLVVLAFSLQGVPDPIEPAPGTIEFDAARAHSAARAVLERGPTREPGSEGDAAAADLVRQRFEAVASGSVAEQRFDASVSGDEVELRNVLLTLPGTSDRTIVVVAGRDSRAGSGAAASAAATGVLLELAAELGVSDRERTLLLASTDGASAGAEGVRELLSALPERIAVEGLVVISQPAAAEPVEPHLITSSTGERAPSLELVRTAEEALRDRAEASAGLDGPLGQIARLALPAAAGEQAALIEDGLDAVAISSAGEPPLPPELAGEDRLEVQSLERFGSAVLALVGALDSRAQLPETGPETYVRVGDNVVPGWALSLLALALLVPPGLAVASELLRAGRQPGATEGAFEWAREWVLVALAPLLAIYVLALVGLIPRPSSPYDPGRFAIGPLEVIALLVLAGAAAAAWWALGLRRLPSEPASALSATAAAVLLAACFAAWLANPFLGLVMAPLAHVVAVRAAPGGGRFLVVPAAAAAALPLVASVVHVATELDWGATAPWQLVVLTAGGGLGFVSAASLLVALAALLALVRATLGGGAPGRA